MATTQVFPYLTYPINDDISPEIVFPGGVGATGPHPLNPANGDLISFMLAGSKGSTVTFQAGAASIQDPRDGMMLASGASIKGWLATVTWVYNTATVTWEVYSSHFYNDVTYARGLIRRTDPGTKAADSAVGFQNFINDTGAGLILMPEGRFDFESVVNLPPGITISGQADLIGHGDIDYFFGNINDDFEIEGVNFHGAFKDCVSIGPGKNGRIANVVGYGGNGTGAGVRLSQVVNCQVSGCTFIGGSTSPVVPQATNFTDGVYVPAQAFDVQGAADCEFLLNRIRGCTNGGIIGNNMARCRAHANNITQITGNGTNTGYGIQFYNLDAAQNLAINEECEADGNYLEGIDGLGIYVQGCRRTRIKLNTVRDACRNIEPATNFISAAISIAPVTSGGTDLGTRQETLVQGNQVINSGLSGIGMAGVAVDVIGNEIDGARDFGIHIWGADLCTFKDNQTRNVQTPLYRQPAQQWTRNTVENNTSDRAVEDNVLLGVEVEEGQSEYIWDRSWDGFSISWIKGGTIGQQIDFKETLLGATYQHLQKNQPVPIVFLDGQNRNTRPGSILRLKKTGFHVTAGGVWYDSPRRSLAAAFDGDMATAAALGAATAHELVIGLDQTHRGVYLNLGVANTTGAILNKVELSAPGSTFVETELVRDRSRARDPVFGRYQPPPNWQDPTGSLSTSGIVEWRVPEDSTWVLGASGLYEARLTFSGALDAATTIREATPLTNIWAEVLNTDKPISAFFDMASSISLGTAETIVPLSYLAGDTGGYTVLGDGTIRFDRAPARPMRLEAAVAGTMEALSNNEEIQISAGFRITGSGQLGNSDDVFPFQTSRSGTWDWSVSPFAVLQNIAVGDIVRLVAFHDAAATMSADTSRVICDFEESE